jgi:hypothetical protein
MKDQLIRLLVPAPSRTAGGGGGSWRPLLLPLAQLDGLLSPDQAVAI